MIESIINFFREYFVVIFEAITPQMIVCTCSLMIAAALVTWSLLNLWARKS